MEEIMTATLFITLLPICLLGAMSPGPSLAVVAKHSLSAGRLHGVISAWAHSCGILIYALLTISGLSVVLQHSPVLFKCINYLGVSYLVFLGIKALQSKGGIAEKMRTGEKGTKIQAARDGFAISILNPKIALFFIALFSQFINPSYTIDEKAMVTFMPAFIDGLWYTLIAMVLSNSVIVEKIHKRASLIDKVSGGFLLFLAFKALTL